MNGFIEGPPDGKPAASERARGGRRWWPWLFALTAFAVPIGVAVTVLVGSGDSASSHAATAQQPVTVELVDLPAATAELYRFASAHATDFAQIPCYCGCDRVLGHRNLADCFVTASGDWDAHASDCGICTAEAIQSRSELYADTPIRLVRQHIVSQFGDANPMSTWSRT